MKMFAASKLAIRFTGLLNAVRGAQYGRLVFWSSTIPFALMFVVAFSNMPIGLLSDAGHDDGLFIRLGLALARGHWLGNFDQFTLAKGPGYPLFLAIVAWSGLSIALVEGAFLVFSLLLLSLIVAKLVDSYLIAATIFVLTLWHPIFLTHRIVRDAIYPSQVIILFALVAAVLFCTLSRKSRFLLCFATGLVFGWFWLTREEGIWVVPGIVLLVVSSRFVDVGFRLGLAALFKAVATAASSFVLVLFLFAAGNKIAYGSFSLVDFKEGNFNDALKALQSIEVDDPIAYLPVPRHTRLAAYEVSPTFATLKDYFDASPTAPWQSGCTYYPHTCGDIAGGWFVWALRDAAASKGHYSSPANASDFYRAIADEIAIACSQGKLTCQSPLFGYLPKATVDQYRQAPTVALSAIQTLALVTKNAFVTPLSSGTRASLSAAERFLNRPPVMPATGTSVFELEGWYRLSGNRWIEISATDEPGASVEVLLRRKESPDLVIAFQDPQSDRQRFRLIVDCSAACTLNVAGADESKLGIPLSTLISGKRQFQIGAGTLHIDSFVRGHDRGDLQDGRFLWAKKLRSLSHDLYTAAMPSFLFLGFVAFIIACIFAIPRRKMNVLLCLAIGLWALIAARVGLLVLVHITSFPAVDPLYLMPAYYLSSVASILSLAALANFVIDSRRRLQ